MGADAAKAKEDFQICVVDDDETAKALQMEARYTYLVLLLC